MAPEFWCQTNATEFWCHKISDAKLSFADVTPLFEFGTTTPSALRGNPKSGEDKVNKVSKYASRTCWRDIKNEVRSLKDQELTCVILCILKWAMGEQRKIWDDILRLASKPLKLLFPRIYALDNIKDATICMKLNEPQHFIITSDRIIEEEIAHSQFKELTDLLIPIVLNPCPDRWFWSLEGSGEFSVASIRRFIDDQRLLTMILKLFGLKVSRLR
ncbi:hypothetical protein Tco_0250671 [Tanacetum coccineum]